MQIDVTAAVLDQRELQQAHAQLAEEKVRTIGRPDLNVPTWPHPIVPVLDQHILEEGNGRIVPLCLSMSPPPNLPNLAPIPFFCA